ncbi:DUF1398 family protein [Xanthobacter dioxanivorans]|uniref:DUF1398 family protein n=1 Tax=Xanthobacter dioxanivorans TaxID=2528964 RepID=A0A974PLR6_9HYPH|nr:DUF1398 family protein [Xanthobacter dioxanivorans]QRG05601.1 DUF1398 family protein [Xanthobacter dioxanivorans]
MDQTVHSIIRDCITASDDERITFGEVVGKLIAAGVERYDADLVRSEKTFYMPDGDSTVLPSSRIDGTASADFSPATVEAAVRAIQAGQIRYKEFCRRILAGGCVGYQVSLAGRRAIYYGRTGDAHVEWFPGAR